MKTRRTAPDEEDEEDSFLIKLGKWKMRVAKAKCLIQIQKEALMEKEGKEKDGCKFVFQISSKVYFLP